MRRCSTSMSVLAALLALGFGTQPNLTRAAAINPNASTSTATVDYRLTSSTSIPAPAANLTSPQVVAMIVPTGSVVPPTQADGTEGSPLTILPDSHGFDPSQLVVALKDTTSATGQPQQQFGLVFYGQGLQPGGMLHFALSVNSALVNNPPQLQSLTPGISIVPDAPATNTPSAGGGTTSNTPGAGGGTTSGGQGGTEVPEPLSVVLWSAVVGAVLARHRLGRKPRRV
jgi:hypothetical protein